MDDLKSFINSLKSKNYQNWDENQTKQAIISRILHILGWNTFDPDEVCEEFNVTGGRVDYALRINAQNKLFIEAKKVNEPLEFHQEQLLKYSFSQGVRLALLTNGIEWWFYLPLVEGDWIGRRFEQMNLIVQDVEVINYRLIKLLNRSHIEDGSANRFAEDIFAEKIMLTKIDKSLNEAWIQIINKPNELLVEILIEETEKLCGYKPQEQYVKDFLIKIIKKPSINNLPVLPHKSLKTQDTTQLNSATKQRSRTRVQQPQGMKITQDELVIEIIQVLQAVGGKATKRQVEQRIFNKFKNEFSSSYFKGTVSHGIPRWQHFIA